MNEKLVVELDVRPILAAGGEPLETILATVDALAPGQCLKLVAPFEPVPLYYVLKHRGFRPSARELPGGAFEVLFSPDGAT